MSRSRRRSRKNSRKQQRVSRKLGSVESLERRDLLTSVSFDAGTGELTISDSAGDAEIRIGGDVNVELNGVEVSSSGQAIPVADVQSMTITTGSGDDVVDLRSTDGFAALVQTNVNVAGGNDFVYGSHSDDLISTGVGHDYAHGFGGSDEIIGGDGDDFLIGGADDDEIHGGAGADNLHGEDGEDELVGGQGNDLLSGGAKSDVLNGGDGDDSLLGDDGDDSLIGEDGDDYLDGGEGTDTKNDNSGRNVVVDDDTGGTAIVSGNNSSPILEFVGNSAIGNVLSGQSEPVKIYGGSAAAFEVNGFDANGDQLSYEIQEPLPAGWTATQVPSQDGMVFWISSDGSTNETASIAVGVSDGVQPPATNGTATEYAESLITIESVAIPTPEILLGTRVDNPIDNGYDNVATVDQHQNIVTVTNLYSNIFDVSGGGQYGPEGVSIFFPATADGATLSLDPSSDLSPSYSGGGFTFVISPIHIGSTLRAEILATNDFDQVVDRQELYFIVRDEGAINLCDTTIDDTCAIEFYPGQVSTRNIYVDQSDFTNPTQFELNNVNHVLPAFNFGPGYEVEVSAEIVSQPAHGSADVTYALEPVWPRLDIQYTPTQISPGDEIPESDELVYKLITQMTLTYYDSNNQPVTQTFVNENVGRVRILVAGYVEFGEPTPNYGETDTTCVCGGMGVSEKTGDSSTHIDLGNETRLVYEPPEPPVVFEVPVKAKGPNIATAVIGRIRYSAGNQESDRFRPFTVDVANIVHDPFRDDGFFSVALDVSDLVAGEYGYAIEWQKPDGTWESADSNDDRTFIVERNRDIGFGPGWILDGIESLSVDRDQSVDGADLATSDSIRILDSAGNALTFKDDGNGAFSSPLDETGTEATWQNGHFIATDKFGESRHFNDAGEMVKRVDRFGSAIDYAYDANGLIETIRRRVSDTVDELTMLVANGSGKSVRTGLVASGTSNWINGEYSEVITNLSSVGTANGPEIDRLSSVTRNPGHGYSSLITTFGYTHDQEGRENEPVALHSVTAPGAFISQSAETDRQGDVVTLTDSRGYETKIIPTHVSRYSKALVHTSPTANLTYAFPQSAVPFVPEPKQELNRRDGMIIEENGSSYSSQTDEYQRTNYSSEDGSSVEEFTARDNDGKLQSRLIRRTSLAGDVFEELHTFDAIGNRTSIDYSDGSSEIWQYDGPVAGLPSAYKPRGVDDVWVTPPGGDPNSPLKQAYTGWTFYDRQDTAEGGEIVTERRVIGLKDDEFAGESNDIITTVEYDKDGRMLKSTDGENNTTEYGYDPDDGWLVTVTYAVSTADQATIQYRDYDLLGNAWEMVDEEGRITNYEYDDIGRLLVTRYPDPNIGSSDTPYDFERRATVENIYDFRGNLERTIRTGESLDSFDNPSNSVTFYEYNLQNELYRMTDDYDPFNSQAVNAQTEYEFDRFGQIIEVIDPLERSTFYSFDRLGRQFRVTPESADGNTAPPVTYTGYNGVGEMMWTVDALGNPTRQLFDAEGRLESITTDSTSMQYEYYADGQIKNQYDALGNRTFFEYDDLRRLWKVTRPTPEINDFLLMDESTIYEYDQNGDLRFMTDTEGNTTEYKYDARRRQSAVISPAPDPSQPDHYPITTYEYYLDGQIKGVETRVTSSPTPGAEEWQKVEYVYNGAGQLWQTLLLEDSDNGNARPVAEQMYDYFGNLKVAIDAEGNRTRYDYDGLQRLVKIVGEHPDYDPAAGGIDLFSDSGKPVTEYQYDAAGQRTQSITHVDSGPQVTSYRYDRLGRLNRMASPNPVDGSGTDDTTDITLFNSNLANTDRVPFTTYEYDLAGNLLSQTNAENETSSWEYRYVAGSYLPTVQTNGNGNPVRFEYDVMGRRTSLTDPPTALNPTGNTTYWNYDDHGRIDTEYSPGSPTPRVYSYDTIGNLVGKTDRNGRLVEYIRDDLYRIETERWHGNGGRDIDFEYDLAGQLLNVTDDDHHYTYEYDLLGRIDLMTQELTGLTRSIEMDPTYNLNGTRRTAATTLLDGNTSTADYLNSYGYDALNRLTSLEQTADGGNAVASKQVEFTYNLRSQFDTVTRIQGGATAGFSSSDYQYDQAGRLTNLDHYDGLVADVSNRIAGYSYTYYSDNLVEEFWSQNDDVIDYEYDNDGQLTSAIDTTSGSNHEEHYVYDEAGNRISSSVETDLETPWLVYWPIDDGVTESGVGFDGLIEGAVTEVTGGAAPLSADPFNAKSMQFDGGNLKTDTTYQLTDEFAVSAWILPDADGEMTIASHGNAKDYGGIGFQLDLMPTTYYTSLRLHLNDGIGSSQIVDVNAMDGILRDGEWHHVGVTVNPDEIAIYIDGLAMRTSGNYQVGSYSPDAVVQFGTTNSTNAKHFSGQMDELRIYDTRVDYSDVFFAYQGHRSHQFTSSYEIGAANRLTRHGDIFFMYDAEGNRKMKIDTITGEIDHYEWDHRNRLIGFESRGSNEAVQVNFENGSDEAIVDAVGNAQNGQLSGNAMVVDDMGSANFSHRALSLDGSSDSFVSFGIQDAIPTGENGLTVAAWFKPEATDFNMGVLSVGNAFWSGGYQLYYTGTPGNEKLTFQFADGQSGSQIIDHAISGSLQNEWHHVAVRFDPSGTLQLFLDGTEVASAASNQDFTDTDHELQLSIGALYGGVYGHFAGLIDDVRFFDYAINESSLPTIMNVGIAYNYHVTASVDYGYDHQNRLIRRTHDVDGSRPQVATTEHYVHDGSQMTLRFDDSGDISNRYLWGPQIDQLLADEQVTTESSEGDLLWTLTDQLGSVRDVARHDGNSTEVILHRNFDSFGNVIAVSSPTGENIALVFAYTGRQYDKATGLQNNLNRWYDADVGRWISEDPIGFAAGDSNLYRYVGNSPANATDPTGLIAEVEMYRWVFEPLVNFVEDVRFQIKTYLDSAVEYMKDFARRYKDHAKHKGHWSYDIRRPGTNLGLFKTKWGGVVKVSSDGCCATILVGATLSISAKSSPQGLALAGGVSFSGGPTLKYCWKDGEEEWDGKFGGTGWFGIRGGLDVAFANAFVEGGVFVSYKYTWPSNEDKLGVGAYARYVGEANVGVWRDRVQWKWTYGDDDVHF